MKKGKLFATNQEITPIDSSGWKDHDTGQDLPGMPRFGEIYHVGEYKYFKADTWWMTLKGFPDKFVFDQESFAPVLGTGEVYEMLQEAEVMV